MEINYFFLLNRFLPPLNFFPRVCFCFGLNDDFFLPDFFGIFFLPPPCSVAFLFRCVLHRVAHNGWTAHQKYSRPLFIQILEMTVLFLSKNTIACIAVELCIYINELQQFTFRNKYLEHWGSKCPLHSKNNMCKYKYYIFVLDGTESGAC